VVIGGISIGNNVKVGAGTVVFEDIPSNSTVVAGKPRIIKR
jgi:serine O-acetyltransferase